MNREISQPVNTPSKSVEHGISDDPEREIPKNLAKLFKTSETIFAESSLTTEEQQSALSIAALIDTPQNIAKLASHWDIREEDLRVRIQEAYYNEDIVRVSNEIFDRNSIPPEEENVPTSEEAFYEVFEYVTRKGAKEILTQREYSLFKKSISGIPDRVIARKLKITNEKDVSRVRSNLRKKIQQQLLQPNGIVKVASFKDPGLSDAARRNVIVSNKFLNEFYTTDEFAREYFSEHTRRVDEELIQKGYVPLREVLEDTEWKLVRNERTKFAPLVTRYKKRLYVSEQNLVEIHELLAGKQIPRKPITYPEYPRHRTLRSFARNENEYSKIKQYIKAVNIPVVRTGYATLVLPEDLEKFLSYIRSEE